MIHLFGFLKAFGISEFSAITQPISKTYGIIWFLTSILFITSAISFLVHREFWWAIGIIAVVLSQVLIIAYWQDAKFGTVLNLIIAASAIIGYSTYSFKEKVKDERVKMSENLVGQEENILSKQMISNLPTVVQTWLLNSGAVGKEQVYSVHLEQEAQMLMKPDQTGWSEAKAEQYFTIEPPAFNWSLNMKMNVVLNVVGRDKFENGRGEMIVKLFSLFPIANAKNNSKIDQATLQRYLAEIVWFPSAAARPYITWEAIDESSARATMNYGGTKGSGVFYFDSKGDFRKFVAIRFKDAQDAEPTEWTVSASKIEERNGIRIPVELKADWKLETGDWTWLKLKISDIEYNL